MSQVQVTESDLRLLRVLDALLEAGGVGGAALRLGVTSSAVSHSLRALRRRFGDPLLVRSGARLVATPLAEAVRPRLRGGLAQLARVLDHEVAFDPSRSRRSFSLATPDYAHFIALPALIGRLRAQAPGIDLRLRPLGPGLRDQLAGGSLDVVLAGAEIEASFALDRELMRTRVVSEPFRCVMRDDHPLARGPVLDVDAYVAAAHVLVSTGGGDEGVVDTALAEIGRARRVAMTVPSFGGAVWFVAASDLVATLPAAAAARGAQRFNLAVRPVPLTLPSCDAYLWWHPRFQHDAAHQWWRRQLLESFAAHHDDQAPSLPG